MPNGIPQDNFNPVIQAGEANGLSAWHVYDRPISSRPEAPGYVLEAAEHVEVPNDLTVVFTLKEGLVYQDRPPVNGRGVLTEDIAIVHEYVRDEDRASDPNLQRHVIDHMETPDDRTIVFHLQQPDAYLFSAGSGFGKPHNNCIIPSELVLGDLDRMEPVGSGPYQLKDYQFQVIYEYERNPTYSRADEGMPYIDTRVRLPLTDATALEAAFRGEQIHVWIPPAWRCPRATRFNVPAAITNVNIGTVTRCKNADGKRFGITFHIQNR